MLNGGYHRQFVVAADPEQIEEITQAIFGGFASTFVAALLLGAIGPIASSHALMKKRGHDPPHGGSDRRGRREAADTTPAQRDDFDLLSQTLNHMLDRSSELMESLRPVSANLAHDLKTPLAHLRNRLEHMRNRLEHMRDLPPQAQTAAAEDAVARVDDILTTFSALCG